MYSKAYWLTYNRMFITDTNTLLEIALISNNKFLSDIAIRVLIEDNRLLSINDRSSLVLLVNKLNVEDIWYLASFDSKYLIGKIARDRLITIIDKTFYEEDKIVYLKKKR